MSPEPSSYEVSFPGKKVLKFEYEVIQLNRLSWRQFVKQPNPAATALMAKMSIAQRDRPRGQGRMPATADHAEARRPQGGIDLLFRRELLESVGGRG